MVGEYSRCCFIDCKLYHHKTDWLTKKIIFNKTPNCDIMNPTNQILAGVILNQPNGKYNYLQIFYIYDEMSRQII